MFSLSQFLYYPSLIAACIFFNWKLSLIIFGCRFIVQFLIYAKTLIKLNEKDLIPLIPFFDIWMFVYYLIFATSLFKKPSPAWK
jgi:hypothetical protein